MRIVYLLLHDFRFASIGLKEFISRFHFSKEYARRMALLGHEVKLYTLSDDLRGKKSLMLDGYELKAFGVSFRFPPAWKFGNSHSMTVMKELGGDAPDIVHFHNYYLWSFPYLAPWIRQRGMPLVSQYHGTDPLRRLKAIAFSPSLRLCDRILVPLTGERALIAKDLRIPAERVRLFPSTGVDTKQFYPTGEKGEELKLLYSGRVPRPGSYLWEKSPQYLIPIIRTLMNQGIRARLVVAGDGPGLEALKMAALRFGVEGSVDFLGQVEHATLRELYSRSTMTFVPLNLDEIGPYWGGSLQESLACGTPVVAFNNEHPGRKRFGVLTPTDPMSAARLISDAWKDRAWLASVGQEGPKLIAENCEWEVMGRQLESMYAKVAGLHR
jgi:glycosyltransferase involved in cell wall biosynthesis